MRNKFFRTAVVAALLISMLVVPVFAETATVTGSDVNMRSGPGTNYSVIDCLPRGAVVTVNDRSNSEWYNVTYNGNTGFMYAVYLSVNEEEHTATVVEYTETTQKPGYINAMYVNFRSGPSTSSSVLNCYNKGKVLTITGYSGDWTAVIIDGDAGYVSSAYVSEASVYDPGNGNDEDEYIEPVVSQPDPTPEPEPQQQEYVEETHEVEETTQKSGYINGDYVRFRTGPSTSYSIIDEYNRGKALTITGYSGDWTAAIIDGESGYVFSQYVVENSQSSSSSGSSGSQSSETPAPASEPSAPSVTETSHKEGYIKGNTVRFRSGPSLNASILGEYYYGNPLTITGYSGEWTAVIIDGTAGYVYSDYVVEGSFNVTPSSGSGSSSDIGVQIASFAQNFVGCRYVWGGNSPDGFDCSGLVYYCYQNFGYTINRVAGDQALNGVHVDHSNLQPGDILCFYSGGGYIGHSGIYIGDGKFVHACNSSTGVIISELEGYYSSRGYEARRVA